VTQHWDQVYGSKAPDAVSWYQEQPQVSRRLVHAALAGVTTPSVVDVGAGASHLVDALLEDGVRDLTLVDLSEEALALVRARVGSRAAFVVHDVVTWDPGRTFAVWHDRAVFHFLTAEPDQQAYVRLATRAVAPGGAVVLGAFATDGPESCSGLPTARHSAQGLAALFSGGFVLEHSEREEHHTPWGAVQPFTWVLLRRLPD
jgi:SAM-dependent methyltransferase